MSENINATDQNTTPEAESGNIMQHIQDMIGDLLKNAVEKMHKTETSKHLGDAGSDASDNNDLTAQMGIADIKGFIDVMQKFIDNVNVMVVQLETGSKISGETDDTFLEGYMATADNVLEIAAFSMKDKTTGLSNRYGFDNRLILEWNRATRDKTALSLVIFSVECTKDGENKISQDDLLKIVSDTLESSIKRTTDFIARWSDDEFAALLPITGLDGATIVADRIHKEVGSIDVPGLAEIGVIPSVSIGVGVHTPDPGEQPSDFINKTHDAYKKAKEAEGSSVVFA